MRRIFNSKRKDVFTNIAIAHTGDLRLIAETLTGAGVQEPTTGFLYCNGATVSRATYKRLYDLIGTTFGVGAGDGLTFSLPDFRGRFPAGYTDGAVTTRISALVLGGVLGAESIALGKAQLPVHTHGVGTANIGASGSHGHAASASVGTKNNQISNDFAFWNSSLTSDQRTLDGGSIAAATHSHPSGEWAGLTGDGSAAGESSLAAAVHQNVHSHQAIGGVLIAY